MTFGLALLYIEFVSALGFALPRSRSDRIDKIDEVVNIRPGVLGESYELAIQLKATADKTSQKKDLSYNLYKTP